ncbi:MAG: Gfo/Idh/MocA family oxidoreductase [Pirellulaceae bacterium]
MASSHPSDPADPRSNSSRRLFIKNGGMILAGSAIVGSNAQVAKSAHAFGSDTIKVGLVGCGRRGAAATIQALNTASNGSPDRVELVAMADAFGNNLQTAYRTINGRHRQQVCSDLSKFVGLDSYRGVMQSDADVVILATPPGFRPLHFEAAIAAGKHVFMEKPVATDAAGVKRVLAAGEIATKKGLAVQVGLQRRHELRYQQTIGLLRSGMIGEPVFARAYWNATPISIRARREGESELEYQLRNWTAFNWLSGDLIGEQHIHNLDVINWLMDSFPIDANGQGGRAVAQDPTRGQVFDHHMIEFTYPGGEKLLSQCRQVHGCWTNVGEHVQCTMGSADISNAVIKNRSGKVLWKSDAAVTKGKGWQAEQDNFFTSLRSGERPNETKLGADSTMTAILGRAATYTGRRISLDEAMNCGHPLADVDSLLSLDSPAPIRSDAKGRYWTPIPGGQA